MRRPGLLIRAAFRRRRGSVALCALVAVALAASQTTLVRAAQPFCDATVTVGGIKARGAGLWEIAFTITTDVAASRGRFNFHVVIKEANGQVLRLTKSDQWPTTRRRGFTVTYRITTQRDQTVQDVEVISASTLCVAG